jgi:hypothetical protein
MFHVKHPLSPCPRERRSPMRPTSVLQPLWHACHSEPSPTPFPTRAGHGRPATTLLFICSSAITTVRAVQWRASAEAEPRATRRSVQRNRMLVRSPILISARTGTDPGSR